MGTVIIQKDQKRKDGLAFNTVEVNPGYSK